MGPEPLGQQAALSAHGFRGIGQDISHPGEGPRDAVVVVLYADICSYVVSHAVVQAAVQGGRERAADDSQGGCQHQERDEAPRGDGVAGDAAQTLHQPAGPHRPHDAGRYAQSQREQPHDQQAQGDQAQRRAQQQGEIDFQISAAQAAGEDGSPAGNLPPEKRDDRQRQQVQVIAVDERGARRPGSGLAKFNDSFVSGGKGRQREHDYGQRRPGGAHAECLPGQGDGSAHRFGVEYQPAQRFGQQRGKESAGDQRRAGQEQSLDQSQDANLDCGRAPALQHGDLGGAGSNDHSGGDGQVVGEDAGDQEHHQEKRDARQQQLLFVVLQDADQPGGRAAVGKIVGHIATHPAKLPLQLIHAFGGDTFPVDLHEPGRTGVDAGITAADLLAQCLFRGEQWNQCPIVVLVSQQLVPAVPVLVLQVDRLDDAHHHDAG